MDYQIALSPALGLTPVDFVQGWNTIDEARTVAEARLTALDGRNFDPFLVGAVAVLSSVGIGIATNAIYDLIKQIVIRKAGNKRIHITQIEQPDGTCILVVDIEKE